MLILVSIEASKSVSFISLVEPNSFNRSSETEGLIRIGDFRKMRQLQLVWSQHRWRVQVERYHPGY